MSGWHIFGGDYDIHTWGVSLRQLRKTVVWMIAAILLWLLASAVDRRTEVEIYSDGGRIHLEVAGTSLSAPMAVDRLTAIEIRAADSIDPPGGYHIVVSTGSRDVINERLPHRFRVPDGNPIPLGDWELDDGAVAGSVWRKSIDVAGPFTVRASFRGRFLSDLNLILDGAPSFSVAIRRGLINNDCFIRDAGGATLATTSIDPTPAADLGATLATLLRAAAAAALLIALFTALDRVSFLAPMPAASRRWRAAPLVIVISVAAVLSSVWVAGSVLEGLPHTPDSLVYLMQARWLLDGSLSGEVSPIQDFLAVPYTYVVENRWLGHYPPGWPLLLAVGLAIGAPWLVAPLLGGLYILLLYLTGRELDGPVLGLAAAVLGLISPMARLIFGSTLSHAAASTLLLATLWLALVARRRRGWQVATLAGVAAGLAFGIRPLTAVAFVIPLAGVLLLDLLVGRDRAAARLRLVGAAAGVLIAAAPALIANHLITGSPFTLPYSLVGEKMYIAANIPFGLQNLDALIVSSGSAIFGWGWNFMHGPAALALAFAFSFLPFMLRRASSTDRLLAGIVVAVMVAHLATRGHGLHGFGPRYYFEIFAPLFLLTARGFQELARFGVGERRAENRLSALLAVSLFLALNLSAAAVLPRRLALYRGYNGVDGSLEQQIAERALDRGLVILPPDQWQDWAMAARMMDLDANAELLFIQAEPDDPAIFEIAGDRPILLWRDGRLVAPEELSVISDQ